VVKVDWRTSGGVAASPPLQNHTHVLNVYRRITLPWGPIFFYQSAAAKYKFCCIRTLKIILRFGDVFACFMPVWASSGLKHHLFNPRVGQNTGFPIRAGSKYLIKNQKAM
jgi:hypothetical protein